MLRRNGKRTSCEPCRMAKVRCDHTTPICRRCQSRNITNQCYYHPAPLTKEKGGNSGSLAKQKDQSQVRSKSKKIAYSSINSQNFYANSIGVSDNASFLGPTSYLSVFRETSLRISRKENDSLKAEFERWRTDYTYTRARLVHLISMIGFYYDQIAWYYSKGGFTIIPGPLVRRLLHLGRERIEKNSWDVTGDWDKIYKEITNATSRPIEFTSSMSSDEFCSLFTREIRWEFVGLMFALAGFSVHRRYKGTHVLNLAKGVEMDAETFAKEMVLAGNACIDIFRQHGQVNDVIIWMRYTHALLATEVLGETGERLYSLFGDLVSSIYAVGLHRAVHSTNIPFYLSETRKRMMAILHKGDKGLSTLLGRPPRLPHRYCDITPPLDLADDQLFLTDRELEVALEGLSEDGWNRRGQFYPATVLRMRHVLSTLKERVLDLALGYKCESYQDLLQTYQSCQKTWDRIPVRFRYNSNCWQEKDITECLARAVVYFEYLSCVFHTQRMRYEGSRDTVHDLLDASMQVVSVVLDLVKHYNHHEVQNQFPWIFLVYGIPAAGVLVTEVHRHTISNKPLPSSPSRSEIIRSLVFLVSWLRTVEMPSSVTATACVEATNMISRLLDETLNYQSALSPSTYSTFQDLEYQSQSHNTTFRISTPSPEQFTEEMTQPQQQQMSIRETSIESSLGFGIDTKFGVNLMSEGLNWLDDLDWDMGRTVTADKGS
ncbi:hypothetical protein BGW36DRAFT_417604 [Talaromyces proteolyticus]|uniref:Zn(2)-C6 fungal-type domain-containing protein n=1 Tax=Talaromyces proteolyticus TaxID=1131652 RepID=A0AAD4KPG4_9EURO|nr:uncharacterized protein BGW36DRAFT_417604 [Talaromyces proteolyticus]KAH8696444.1 hypothetical protein BGW36DRAFT_417604 [Talaromyces proteolyticus]